MPSDDRLDSGDNDLLPDPEQDPQNLMLSTLC